MALFASRAFAEVQGPIHFFSSAADPDDLQAKMQRIVASGAAPRKVLHVDDLGLHEDLSAYRAVILMLGNSTHNLPAFHAAMRSRSEGIPRYFYLHDARIAGLLGLHYGDSATLRRELRTHYPERADTLAHASDNELYLGEIFGLRILHGLLGTGTFLVNSGRARPLIEAELGLTSAPPIQTLFHPIFSIPDGPSLRRADEGTLLVGHFGELNMFKRPELLIQAVEVIAKRRRARLLFAGYRVRAYFPNSVVPDFDDIVENADDDDLLALMRGIDVAVQPRFPDHGESSGDNLSRWGRHLSLPPGLPTRNLAISLGQSPQQLLPKNWRPLFKLPRMWARIPYSRSNTLPTHTPSCWTRY